MFAPSFICLPPDQLVSFLIALIQFNFDTIKSGWTSFGNVLQKGDHWVSIYIHNESHSPLLFSFYFNTRETRSAKKKEISPVTEPSNVKRRKTLSNPEEDFLPRITPEKSTSPPKPDSVLKSSVNYTNITASGEVQSTHKKSAVTPVSSKKRLSKVARGSATKSLASVDHNKQYVIDAGQKDFDGLKTCVDCGMIYTKGVKEDELHHKSFHDSVIGTKDSAESPISRTPKNHSKGISISPKSLALKLKSLKWSLNSKTIKERVLEWVQLPTLNSSGRIIGFTSEELLKNEKLLNLVDKYFRKAGQEIGIESGIMEYNQLFMHVPNRSPSIFLLMIINEKKNNGSNTPAKNNPASKLALTPKSSSSKTNNSRVSTPGGGDQINSGDYVIGLISCESITTAERLISENPLSCTTNENIPAKIGVSRLWVSSSSRRQNVSTHLLDALRKHFMTMTASTSQVIPKEQVAFSDPTESGLKFAQKYFNRKDILVFSLFHSLTPAAIEEL